MGLNSELVVVFFIRGNKIATAPFQVVFMESTVVAFFFQRISENKENTFVSEAINDLIHAGIIQMHAVKTVSDFLFDGFFAGNIFTETLAPCIQFIQVLRFRCGIDVK